MEGIDKDSFKKGIEFCKTVLCNYELNSRGGKLIILKVLSQLYDDFQFMQDNFGEFPETRKNQFGHKD